jgi:beta-glucosidase/6-phospho-beta-glucosidase/beta-galactosidase
MTISRYSFALLLFLVISPVSSQFPENFIWGAATAAAQIEGGWIEEGKSPSVWDNLSHLPGFIADGSNTEVGPDSYHRFKEDIKIMKDHGIKHYRMSISWPRIIPQGIKGKPVNSKGIEYYREVFQTLLDNDITPYVTLYHWDLPTNLVLKGRGIYTKYFVEDFLYYADVCFKEFGDLVKYWFTFNEIWVMALLMPMKDRDRGDMPYKIAHNSLLAHAHAVKLYREKYNTDGKGKIGIVLNSSMMYPKKEGVDEEARKRALIYSLDWIAHPVFTGDYPQIMVDTAKDRMPKFTEKEKELLKGSIDFIGINHYFSELCEADNNEMHADYWTDRNVKTSYNPDWKKTDSGWPIVPEGLRDLLLYIHENWTHDTKIPIWVTENGLSLKEENINSAVHDIGRVEYHNAYIKAMGEAISKGARVEAYFVWSLLDNFEWWSGYSKRFGMIRVEYTNPPKRIAKGSLKWYGEFIKSANKVQTE